MEVLLLCLHLCTFTFSTNLSINHKNSICFMVWMQTVYQRMRAARVIKIKLCQNKINSWVCGRQTLCSATHLNDWKSFGAHVCIVTFKHLPIPLRNHIQSFGTPGQLLQIIKNIMALLLIMCGVKCNFSNKSSIIAAMENSKFK